MFILKSKETIKRAIETARRRHTSVRFVQFGVYDVRGTAGNFYRVTCERMAGERVVCCGCVAGEFGSPCYHAAAALSLHVGLATQRAH